MTPRSGHTLVGLALLVALGCRPPNSAAERPKPTPDAAIPAAPKATAAPNTTAAPDTTAVPCGALGCMAFATPAEALAQVLADSPLVIGIGEAHALAGQEQVLSTAQRFSRELLPLLRGRASHLLVELINPNPACADATETVRNTTRPIAQGQSKHGQNDYVMLGHQAKALGIAPFVLSPTCGEYRAIASAGEETLPTLLSTVATVTARMARHALAQNQADGIERAIVAYGGALHNDRYPLGVRSAWSYGPALSEATGNRYIELDLIVREFIKDTDTWKRLPWYDHFRPALHTDRTVLMQPSPGSYVLFFSAAPVAPADGGAPGP